MHVKGIDPHRRTSQKLIVLLVILPGRQMIDQRFRRTRVAQKRFETSLEEFLGIPVRRRGG